MIKLAHDVLITFWLVSPVLYAVGWGLGVWRTGYDWAIAIGLTLISTFVVCLNYKGEK